MSGSHTLLGILLGFGKQNSLIYQELSNMWDNCYLPTDYKYLENNYPVKFTQFPELIDNSLFFIDLPIYGEDKNHQESIKIREDYINTRATICDVFSKKDFLKTLLIALTENG